MIYETHLNQEPFLSMKSGAKTVEVRINDEKRRLFKTGDILVFINRENKERLKTKIVALHKFKSFAELYKKFTPKMLGYKNGEIASPADMQKYYPLEEEQKYGVVGIQIALLAD